MNTKSNTQPSIEELNETQKLIIDTARSTVPALQHNTKHEISIILSPIWGALNPEEHKWYGSVFSRVVKRGFIPLKRRGRGSDNHALYCRFQ
ncbi:MAG: hypothetical protein HOE61_02485 [Candidatus Marinimicrobia bacterium]|nr:hypothetical protein [Candidatus Neomarinimicrobiota bacterium]